MTSANLYHHIAVRGRFARSIRLDKDAGHAEKLEGYLPTGRSLEVVRRLSQALLNPSGTRAFSITGPYGSGKSSLALFIDALLGRADEAAHAAALNLIQTYDPKTAAALLDARQQLGAATAGFLRAVITAPQREPITTTVLRAMLRGATEGRVAKDLREELGEALHRAESTRYATPSHREVGALIRRLAARRPVLLVIDEFGKNLEAFADSGQEGDLYLLQELAEWASGDEGLPLIVATIQHLAFEAYASDTTAAQRREWSKVQGRFEDIPFVDSAASTRSLIASALVHSNDPSYLSLRDKVAAAASSQGELLGLASIAEPGNVAACYPLHPTALLALPELCARYGQNERTLFSFLASTEPQSVTTFLREEAAGDPLPWVRLDRVYDYFVDSASTFVGASSDASRWIEVETTIRDAHGITDAQRRVLKTVGVLNLITAGGALRASAELISFAAVNGGSGTATAADVDERLRELEAAGLLVFRDFAGEYRLWHGSDFDLAGALRTARGRIRQERAAKLLQEVQPLRPLVAARHTIQTGTTRAFARVHADRQTCLPALDKKSGRADQDTRVSLHGCDGLLVLLVDPAGELPDLPQPANGLPVVTVRPANREALVAAAVEVGALLDVSKDPGLSAEDRAAHRELLERISYARQVLDREIASAFGGRAEWVWHNPANKDGTPAKRPRRQLTSPASVGLSDVFDRVFADCPPVLNETINRNELTSQGSKARRMLIEAILTPSRQKLPRLGLEGDGPETAMCHALLIDPGVQESVKGLQPPTSAAWKPAWRQLSEALRSATDAPVSVGHVLRELTAPPIGLKDGTASVLLIVGLVVHASDIAVYEHGTFRPKLDAPLAERLVRNPDNFGIKHLAARPGTKRHAALIAVAEALSRALPTQPAVAAALSHPTVLTLARSLVDVLHRRDDDFTRKSKLFQGLWAPEAHGPEMCKAHAVRDVMLTTHEPDAMLFEHLPAAVGMKPLPASGRGSHTMAESEVHDFSHAIAEAVATIDSAFDRLAGHVEEVICEAADRRTIREVAALADDLNDTNVLTPVVRRFAAVAQMRDAYTDNVAWLGAVTEAVCGQSLRHWTDHSAPGHLQRLRETVTDYARVADLARFKAGQTDKAFRGYQLEATNQRGESVRTVVTVPERALQAVQDLMDETLRTVERVLEADPSAARRALLAAMSSRLLDDDSGTQPKETSAPGEMVVND